MMMPLLQELSGALGISGSEEETRTILARALRPYVDELRSDPLGSLIAYKGSASTGPGAPHKVLICAHLDEVGLMITSIDENGRLRFRKVGGINDQVLISKAVLIGKDRIPGVIGSKPVHLLRKEERERMVKVESMYIDIGVSSRQEAERLVKIGETAGFLASYLETGGTLRGKAFDDRVGCAMLVELLKGSYPFDLYGAFTVQEEIGTRGARVVAYSVAPEVALVLEATVCDDLPKKKDVSSVSVLGSGPVVTIMDRSFIADRRLVSLIIEEAEAHSIPFQVKQPLIGSTDAGAVHLVGEGIPTAVISVPCRYLHSPMSVISKRDLENTFELATKVLERLGRDWPFEMKRL